MRVTALALALGGSGCAQLFGIEDTTSASTATLQLQRVSIGATVVTAPLDLGSATPQFLAADASEVPGTATAAGAWSAALSNPLGVVFTAPDLPKPYLHALELGTASQRAGFYVFEHTSPQPAPSSMMMLDVTLPGTYAAGQTFQVLAVGAWTSHVLAGAELPAVGAGAIATTIPYAQFLAVTASPAARITSQDVVVVLRYSGATLTGQLVVPPFDQSAGTDAVMGTMASVTPAAPFDAQIDPAAAAARFAAAMPAGAAPSAAWEIDAAPGYAVGATTGIRLDAATVAMSDTMISGSYANPFVAQHWQAALTYAAASTRTYMLGTTPVALAARFAAIADPQPGAVLGLQASLPKLISLAQTPLSQDGRMLTIDPTAPADVDITPDNATANTLYAVTLEELAVTGGAVTSTPVIGVIGTTEHLVLPANVLQTGHTYTLIATCVAGGYPNAATGDVQTFALPVSFGEASSGVFTVSP